MNSVITPSLPGQGPRAGVILQKTTMVSRWRMVQVGGSAVKTAIKGRNI